ncbi:MAG TPA: sulfurtransferase [Rhodanobacteraceae bacterium]|nr:sulfurtransferase [Rhodanobacteraceae bacterium]
MSVHQPLIDVAGLAAMPAARVLVVDCRFELADPEKGRREYKAGHIPGAVFAHLDEDLSELGRQAEGLGRHPLPDAAAFAAVLGRWGWQPGLPVVAYDAGSGAMVAARLWWLLRVAGIEARVLDGGIAAWSAAGQPLQGGTVARTPTHVAVAFDDAQTLYTDAIERDLRAPDMLLLDARAAPRYRGEVEPIDRVGGHVPGARNRPFADNLQADGRFKPLDQLRAEFAALLGDRDPAEVVHMCGSGATACHNLLAMEQAGLHGSRLYAPSWSGWVSDPARPVATGAAPG